MKILQIIQRKQLRGAELSACMLSQHLVVMGHSVRMVSLEDGDAVMPFEPGVHALSADLKKRFWDWSGWKRLAAEVDDFKPDLVQANAGDTLKYAVLSKIVFRWKAPLIFRNASMVSSYINSTLVKRFNAFLIRRVEYVISVSESSRADFVKTFPSAATKIAVIPVGIEDKPVHRINREPGYAYLVHVGGFSFEKNHKGLLRIFKLIRIKRPDAYLWLVGDGPLREPIEGYCRELGLEKNVLFLGYKSDALDYIASADLLVLPSIIEGFPAVVLEAMYTSTPVVTYHVGGVGEVIENKKTGYLLKKDDEHGFAEACILGLGKNAEVVSQIENAKKLVIERYLNRALAHEFVRRYEDIVQGKRNIAL